MYSIKLNAKSKDSNTLPKFKERISYDSESI